MSYSEVQSTVMTLGEVMAFMAPFAGGQVPDARDQEYADWVNWIGNKQEEFARRGFWRRCLTRVEMTLDGVTTVLPDRFHKPNGLYMVIVDGVDWMDPYNSDEQNIFVEMENDATSLEFGNWQMRFKDEPDNVSAVVWYFSNPPKPQEDTDRLLLPGDMIGFASLAEYFRTTGAEGSQDKSEEDAENRFREYISLEVIPAKNELLIFDGNPERINRSERNRNYYRYRSLRNKQY